MRTAALALAHLLLCAALLALAGVVAFPGHGTALAPEPAVRGAASAILYVLQLPIGPLAQALDGEGGLRVLLLLLSAVGNAALWAVAVRAVWKRARRRGGA